MRALKRNIMSTVIGCLVVACSVAIPTGKGGGTKGTDAVEEGQQSGSNASAHQDQAEDQGNEIDEVVCDGENEGIGWCEDDANLVFCAGETWWRLDCSAVEEGSYCDYDDEENEVDCWVDVEEEEEGE